VNDKLLYLSSYEGRFVEGSVTGVVEGVDVGAVFQQELHHLRVSEVSGQVQRRPALIAFGPTYVHQQKQHTVFDTQINKI
jgi:hypothetical protein